MFARCLLYASGVILVAAQIHLDPSFGSCDMGDLSVHLTRLNAVCSESCTAECVAALMPLRGDCRSVIDELYDAADGHLDGESSELTTMYDRCLAVPIPE